MLPEDSSSLAAAGRGFETGKTARPLAQPKSRIAPNRKGRSDRRVPCAPLARVATTPASATCRQTSRVERSQEPRAQSELRFASLRDAGDGQRAMMAISSSKVTLARLVLLQRLLVGKIFGRVLVQCAHQLLAAGRNANFVLAQNVFHAQLATIELLSRPVVRP